MPEIKITKAWTLKHNINWCKDIGVEGRIFEIGCQELSKAVGNDNEVLTKFDSILSESTQQD